MLGLWRQSKCGLPLLTSRCILKKLPRSLHRYAAGEVLVVTAPDKARVAADGKNKVRFVLHVAHIVRPLQLLQIEKTQTQTITSWFPFFQEVQLLQQFLLQTYLFCETCHTDIASGQFSDRKIFGSLVIVRIWNLLSVINIDRLFVCLFVT